MMRLTMTSSSPVINGSSGAIAIPACDNLTDLIHRTAGADKNIEFVWRNTTEIDPFEGTALSLTMENITCLEHAPGLTNAMFLKAIVLAVMTVLSLAANVVTIYSVAKNRRAQHNYSVIYTLILHLSVADLLVTIFCIGGEALWSYTVAWIWGNVTCKIFKFMQVFSLYLSTFVLVLIGIDRFVAVKYPMRGLNAANRCTRPILFVWLLSLVLATPQIVIFHVAQGPFIEEFTQCVTHGFYTEPWQEQLYLSLSLFFMFILPLGILITTYVSTVITLARNEKIFKAEVMNDDSLHLENIEANRRKLMHRAKNKSLRISIVIVAAFILWWTPYYTMMIIFMFLNPDRHVAERRAAEWNIFLWHEQQFGQSPHIWSLPSLAKATPKLSRKVNDKSTKRE
ncbi:gonadotropin-releasing hormone receptor isoform X1 [Prorops nasuta]|uniref:gonadotropin-releasing hormone receptor isoform X1 n=1 Tax=Prorops nasuta TaxID=863751 RepID=UPI0034CDC225